MKFESLKDDYSRLWASMVIRTRFKPALEASAKKIIANRDRYAAVSAMTNVPWYVIGLIHQMEAGCSFDCHLHNGDSLAAKTVNVPAKRPATGHAPYRWEASACDALLMKSLEAVKDWTIERICYELERYNGFGYRDYHKSVLTPYLWSGTTHYARGKYVADGKWDADAVSGQSGAIALLKTLMDLDESVRPSVSETDAVPLVPAETVSDSFKKAEQLAPVTPAKAATAAGAVVAVAVQAAPALPSLPVPSVPESVSTSLTNLDAWKAIGEHAWTLKNFAAAQPVLSVCVGLTLAAVWFWPKKA